MAAAAAATAAGAVPSPASAAVADADGSMLRRRGDVAASAADLEEAMEGPLSKEGERRTGGRRGGVRWRVLFAPTAAERK